MRPEHVCHGRALGLVVGGRAGAVGVEVAHRLLGDPRVGDGALHRARGALLARHHHVGGVRGHADAHHLGQDLGPPRPRALALLEDEHARPLALHHAVAREREGPAGVARHHAQALPGLEPAEAQHRLRAPRDHHRREARADEPERLAHGVVRRRAGRGDGEGRPLKVVRHGEVARRGVVHQLRHHEGVDAVAPLLVDRAVVLVVGVEPPARGAQHHARARGELAPEGEPRLRDGLARGDQRELGEPVVERDLLAVPVLLGNVAVDLRADLDGEPLHVADLQGADAAAALAHGLKRARHVVPEGVDRAGAGDDDAVHGGSGLSLARRRAARRPGRWRPPTRCRSPTPAARWR